MAWHKIPKYRKDGRFKNVEYTIWNSMVQRCRNPKNSSYSNYGGRGIDVYDGWDHFDVFFHDMGKRPSSKHQIDRIDNNMGYSKDNCRWVLKGVNQANKRRPSTRFGAYLKSNGKYQSLIGIAGKIYALGTFEKEEEAQSAYKIMFKEWYGFEPSTEVL